MADKLIFKVGSNTTFEQLTTVPEKGNLYLSITDNLSHLDYSNGEYFLNIVPRLLTVANGGTGKQTFTTGGILLGNNTTSLTEIIPGQKNSVLTSTGNFVAYKNLSLDITPIESGSKQQIDLKIGDDIVSNFVINSPTEVIISRWEE